jgi:hypothetical protein
MLDVGDNVTYVNDLDEEHQPRDETVDEFQEEVSLNVLRKPVPHPQKRRVFLGQTSHVEEVTSPGQQTVAVGAENELIAESDDADSSSGVDDTDSQIEHYLSIYHRRNQSRRERGTTADAVQRGTIHSSGGHRQSHRRQNWSSPSPSNRAVNRIVREDVYGSGDGNRKAMEPSSSNGQLEPYLRDAELRTLELLKEFEDWKGEK